MKKDVNFKAFEDRTLRARNKCKCGHTVYMSNLTNFCICSWCGRKVENKRKKFKEIIKEKLK